MKFYKKLYNKISFIKFQPLDPQIFVSGAFARPHVDSLEKALLWRSRLLLTDDSRHSAIYRSLAQDPKGVRAVENLLNKFQELINFDEFLRFLNLDIKLDLLNLNKWNSLSKELREIIVMFQKTIKLSIDSIESSYALEKLIQLSEKCSKLLRIEFPNQENEVDSNTLDLNNFCNQPFNDYDKCRFNHNDDKSQCSKKDQEK